MEQLDFTLDFIKGTLLAAVVLGVFLYCKATR